MSEYRINVRFNLSDTEHTAIIDHLNSLDKEKYKSRNQFIIDAIKSAIAYADKQTADDELLEPELLAFEDCIAASDDAFASASAFAFSSASLASLSFSAK